MSYSRAQPERTLISNDTKVSDADMGNDPSPLLMPLIGRNAFRRALFIILTIVAAGSGVVTLESMRERILWSASIGYHDWVAIEIQNGDFICQWRSSILYNRIAELYEPRFYGGYGLETAKYLSKSKPIYGRWKFVYKPSRPTPYFVRMAKLGGFYSFVRFPLYGIVALSGIYPLSLLLIRVTRYRKRKKNGRCVSCSYILYKPVSNLCPECGSSIKSVLTWDLPPIVIGFGVFLISYYVWLEIAGTDSLDGLLVSWPKGPVYFAVSWYLVGPIPPFLLSISVATLGRINDRGQTLAILSITFTFVVIVFALDQRVTSSLFGSYVTSRFTSFLYPILVFFPAYVIAWIVLQRAMNRKS